MDSECNDGAGFDFPIRFIGRVLRGDEHVLFELFEVILNMFSQFVFFPRDGWKGESENTKVCIAEETTDAI